MSIVSAIQIDACVTSEMASFDAVQTLLQKKMPFDAFVVASDQIAITAIRAAIAAGLRGAHNVAIVVYD